MNILAFDIGMKRTGVALANTDDGVAVALDTIHHSSSDDLLTAMQSLIKERSAELVVVGLPLLLSGEDGSQSRYVRDIAEKLEDEGISVHLMDERYTTPSSGDYDSDAAAACVLLGLYLEQRK